MPPKRRPGGAKSKSPGLIRGFESAPKRRLRSDVRITLTQVDGKDVVGRLAPFIS